MEWDTAAGDAILTGAGGIVTEGDSNRHYSMENQTIEI